jgi:hypothetical protein
MTQTNTQEVALFTPVEPAELTAIEGGEDAIGPEPVCPHSISSLLGWRVPPPKSHPDPRTNA